MLQGENTMPHQKPSRRDMLKTGIAGVTAHALSSALSPGTTQAAETGKQIKVVAIMGDYWHNPISREMHLRGILARQGW